MESVQINLVAKVHPLDRELLPEDPMELMGTTVMGDPGYMLQCVISEYAWMGWSADQLMGLFRSPEYPALQDLLAYFGEARVRQLINTLLDDLRGLTISATVDETPDPDLVEEHEHEPERIQLMVRHRESFAEIA